jgi:hypothetical protein
MSSGITIGRIGQTGAGPTRFAERAIAATAAIGTNAKTLLALNRTTGRVSLHDHDENLPAEVYFARGVSRTSDPDCLAEDLMTEAASAGLLSISALREMERRMKAARAGAET